jgi:hypothetical protein
VSETKTAYNWGASLNFTVRGNALPYCISGWSEPEAGIAWTDGLNAKLSFAVEPPTSDVLLSLSCVPYLGEGKIPFQELHVFVNFLRVAFAVLKAPTDISIKIPQYVFSQPHLDIDFYLPRAVSPAFLRLNPDLRQLGISVSQLTMATTAAPAGGTR